MTEWQPEGVESDEQGVMSEEGKAKKLLKGWIIELCGAGCVYLAS
jgi:hypothetical protein